ncbi:MAG: hypothetical protein M0Z45_08995 [Actinomycetota bacterium]|nr:hypothetical protein [Actinomycetota bacterium]
MSTLIFATLLILFIALAVAPLIADLPQRNRSESRDSAKLVHPAAQKKANTVKSSISHSEEEHSNAVPA